MTLKDFFNKKFLDIYSQHIEKQKKEFIKYNLDPARCERIILKALRPALMKLANDHDKGIILFNKTRSGVPTLFVAELYIILKKEENLSLVDSIHITCVPWSVVQTISTTEEEKLSKFFVFRSFIVEKTNMKGEEGQFQVQSNFYSSKIYGRDIFVSGVPDIREFAGLVRSTPAKKIMNTDILKQFYGEPLSKSLYRGVSIVWDCKDFCICEFSYPKQKFLMHFLLFKKEGMRDMVVRMTEEEFTSLSRVIKDILFKTGFDTERLTFNRVLYAYIGAGN